MSGISGVFNSSSISQANIKKRLTQDSVQFLMHGGTLSVIVIPEQFFSFKI